MATPIRRLVTETALDTTLSTTSVVVPATSGPLGNRWVFLGDSITAGGTQNSTNYQSNSWPLWASLFSAGRIWMVRNAGIGGNTTTAMLARFDSDVTPYKPNVVCLMAGTNDVSQNVTTATFQSNVRAIHAKCREIGAALVLSTITPTSDTAKNPTRVHWNHWLSRYAAEHGLHLFDAYGVMVDQATGTLRAGDHNDGIHPNEAALYLLGKTFSDMMTPLTRQFSLPLVQDTADAVSAPYTSNRLWETDTNNDGIPDSTSAYGGSTGFSHQLVPSPYGIGRMAQVTLQNSDGMRVLTRSLPTDSWAVGDRLAFMGVLNTTGETEATVQMKFTNGASPSTVTPVRVKGGPITGGVFYYEAAVTAGTTGVVTELVVLQGTCTAAVGQLTVLNLTRYGLV